MTPLPVEFLSDARDEAREARSWYAERSPLAAERFILELDRAVQQSRSSRFDGPSIYTKPVAIDLIDSRILSCIVSRQTEFKSSHASTGEDAPVIGVTDWSDNRLIKGVELSDIKITVTDRAGRKCASSGSKWEPIMGYSRAVRSGNFIAVTGTVGVNADGTYSKSIGDQTRRSLDIIKAAIEALGGRIDQVIRTRMFVTDVSKWEAVAKVHGEVFAEIRPATSILEVPKLIDADAQIEIEADVVL